MIKKIKKALPPHSGTVSGRNVFTQFSPLKIIYCGTTSTWLGTIIVISIQIKKKPLPWKRIRVKP